MRTRGTAESGFYLKAAGAVLLVVALVGMIPMTFLFAHLGGAMTAEEEPLRLLNLLALLGLTGLIWAGWKLRRQGRDES